MDKHIHKNQFKGKLILFLMVGLIIGSIFSTTSSAAPLEISFEEQTDLYPHLQIISSTSDKIVLEFTPPLPEFTQIKTDTGLCQSPSILGLSNSASQGQADLPSQGVLIGIPESSQPILEIISIESTELGETYHLCGEQGLKVDLTQNDIFSIPEMRTAEISLINQFLPADPAALVSQGMIRSQAYVSLQFNPLQYNASSGALLNSSKIRVEITFNAPQTSLDVNGQFSEDPYFEENYQRLLINYEQAKAWRTEPTSTALRTEPTTTTLQPEPLYVDSPLYKIIITEEGVYQLSYADLANAGLPVDTLDPHTLKMFYQDQQIAIQVIGETDSSFDDGDTILFYGENINIDTSLYKK